MTNSGSGLMTYDAENRLTNAAGVTYTYDGDGKRVKKSSGKLYWYGPDGEVQAESDLAGTWTIEHMYFNGKRLARRELVPGYSIRYHYSDHLGSASVIATSGGLIYDESDYYPFGGERVITNSDPNQYKFTGKERDAESGLDYFGARYHSSSVGRFLSADSSSYSTLRNPQSWNLYAYTLNNPLRYADPDGHEVQCKTNATDCLKAAQASVANKEAAARLKTTTVAGKQNWLQKLFGIKAADKTTLTITGDVKSFKALGGNASKLADLITDKRTVGLSVSSTYSPHYTGTFDKIISYGSEYSLNGGATSRVPSQGAEPEAWVDPNPATDASDTDAARDGIPPANLGEKTAHELLGHVWGEMVAGHRGGTAQNKQDSINAENEVRRTDPTRGQKTKHHD